MPHEESNGFDWMKKFKLQAIRQTRLVTGLPLRHWPQIKSAIATVSFSQLQHLDTKIFLTLQKHFCHYNYYLFRSLSRLGDGWLYPLIAACLFVLEPDQGKSFLLSSCIAFAIEVPVYLYLKNRFKRDRPQQKLPHFKAKIEPSDQFSFPSGHTAAACVFALQLSVFYPPWATLAFPLALLIGLSRIFLGVHFPGDILAGAILGLVCSGLTLGVLT